MATSARLQQDAGLELSIPPAGPIRVGISGWIYAPWRNTFYPPGLPQRRELEFASRQLHTLEINSTSYGSETPATYARWASETPAGFVFSVRAPRQVTERGALGRTSTALRAFLNGGLAELGPSLGPVVWQLPPNRAYDHDDLAAFFELLPRELNGHPLQHVIDARHPSFRGEDYLALARQQQIATAQCDTDGPLDPHRITAPLAYVRLMRARTAEPLGYPADAIEQCADQMGDWLEHRLPPPASADAADAPRVLVYLAGGARQRDPAAAMALARAVDQRLNRPEASARRTVQEHRARP